MKATTYTYKVDGTVEEKEWDKMIPLEDLRSAVGGSIETVPYWVRHKNKPCVAFCNEEGKLHGLKYNAIADTFWALERSAHVYDHLVGDIIVICGDREFMRNL